MAKGDGDDLREVAARLRGIGTPATAAQAEIAIREAELEDRSIDHSDAGYWQRVVDARTDRPPSIPSRYDRD